MATADGDDPVAWHDRFGLRDLPGDRVPPRRTFGAGAGGAAQRGDRAAARRGGGDGRSGARSPMPSRRSDCCSPIAALRRRGADRMMAVIDVELPLEAEEFLVWLASERGRARNTIEAYRRDLVALSALADQARPHDDERDHGRSHRFRRRAASIDGGHDVGRPAVGGDPHAAPLPGHRTGPPGRSDRTARRRPRAVGHPQAAQRGAGDEPARRRDRQRAARAPRSGLARTAVRHRRSDLRGGRPVGGRHRLRRSRSCACSARDRRSASCPTARLPRCRPRRLVLAVWPGGAGARSVEAPRRRRGGLPQPARRPPQPAGGVARDPQVRRSGRHPRPPLAARAAPLVRDAPARPRRRPADRAGDARARLDLDDAGVHARSARSGCGRSTGRRIRGRCMREQDASHLHASRIIWRRGSSGRCRRGLPNRVEVEWAASQLLPGELRTVAADEQPGPAALGDRGPTLRGRPPAGDAGRGRRGAAARRRQDRVRPGHVGSRGGHARRAARPALHALPRPRADRRRPGRRRPVPTRQRST